MDKILKLRMENTTNGKVKKWKSNCALVISVDEQDGDYRTKVYSVVNCHPAMLFKLMEELEAQKKEIKRRIEKHFHEYLSQFFDEEEESDE